MNIPELRSLEALLDATSGDIQVWEPKRSGLRINAGPEAAKALYQRGHTLVWSGLHSDVEALQRLQDAVLDPLGGDPADRSCWAFASPPGSGVHRHFDVAYTFNVQLRGAKRWWVDREGRSRHFVARPGSVVWLPKGWYHRTRVIGPEASFSVTFSTFAKTWARQLSEQIEQWLLDDPAWNRPAFGYLGSRAQRKTMKQDVVRLLGELPARLGALSAEGFFDPPMPAYGGPPWRFIRNGRGRLRARRHANGKITLAWGRLGTLEVDSPAVARLTEWALGRERPFRAVQALPHGEALSPTEVVAALRYLVKAKWLRRARVSGGMPGSTARRGVRAPRG